MNIQITPLPSERVHHTVHQVRGPAPDAGEFDPNAAYTQEVAPQTPGT